VTSQPQSPPPVNPAQAALRGDIDPSKLRPLFPPTRILSPDAQQAEKLAREAQELREQAEAYKQRIEAEAEEARDALLAAAELEAERIRQEAAAQAFARAGESIAPLLVAFERESQDRRARQEQELSRLACSLATQLLQAELTQHPESILSLTRAVLPRLQTYSAVAIHVRPEHAAILRQARELLQAELPHCDDLQVVPDPDLPIDGLVLRTRDGDRVATPSEQLAAFEERLADRAATAKRSAEDAPKQREEE
jgi:flagellar biosynthesis/type III secretory pathway protein FliH